MKKTLEYKKFPGLYVCCKDCGRNVNHKQSGKKKCNHPIERQFYKGLLKVPGSNGERKSKSLKSKTFDDAVKEFLEFKNRVYNPHLYEEIPEQEKPELLVDALAMYVDYMQDIGVPHHKRKYLSTSHIKTSMQFLKEFGTPGKGPFEFKYPTIVKTFQNEPLCYVHDNGQLYYINDNYEIVPSKIELPYMAYKGDLQMYSFTDSLFYYIDNTKKGKAIFRGEVGSDTTLAQPVFDLAFSEKHKNWASYIGGLGASRDNSRLVYAYKYFRRITFMDTEGENVRTLIFKTKDTKAGTNTEMLAPDNVTHYWGLSAQKNHIYFLYSGRTPIDVHNANRKSSGYIFVEQFDWNGNPVRRFKLDHWGYFCVSHDETAIYQFATTEEHPIVKYQLPAL